ncbi:MAG: carboxylesterase/lipase family protein [Thermomicrobiales bacterium]
MPTTDATPDPSLIRETTAGPVRGQRCTPGAETVVAWKGIPYAAPPIGDRRWRVPAPPDPWSEVRDCTAFGHAEPQPPMPLMPLGDGITMDEDCLVLNVWADEAATAASPKPVMVWIHGGAYVYGSASQRLYDGARFADGGEVVLVSVNYRLGAFGFLELGSFATPECPFDGNLGLRDLLRALEWVRDNIAAFGGDPARVTVFGQSAGGGLVTTLMAVPAAAGLFHRAIAESSPASSVYAPALQTEIATRFLEVLGVSPGDAATMRAIPAGRLVDASKTIFAEIPTSKPGVLPFSPTVDGELVPLHPVDAFRQGRALPVPLLIGTNHDETKAFKRAKSPLVPISKSAIAEMMADMLAAQPDLVLPDDAELATAYAGFRPTTFGIGISRDLAFRLPTLWVAEGQSADAPTWLYRFDFATPMLELLGIGATHSTELPYVWNNPDANPKDITFRLGGRKEGDDLARRMHRRWRSFATAGTPDGDPGDVHWPAFDTTDRATLRIDRQDHIVDDLDADLRATWGDEIIAFS